MSRLPIALFDELDVGEVSVAGPKLTVLSYGAGQESTALLLSYIHDREFRSHFAPNDFIVVFADTGDEHEHTYEHIEKTKALCALHEIKFVHILPEMGYHCPAWSSLRDQYNTNCSVGSKAYVKSCSYNLKIYPIYNFLEDYIADKYNLLRGRKRAFKEFSRIFGKVNVLIGIAHGEESRMAGDEFKDKWKQMALKNVYPLVQMGMDRFACQSVNRTYLDYEVKPSNCVLCPWLSMPELLYMHRFMRSDFEDWVRIEKNKFAKHADKGDKNLGVWGKWIKDENRPYTLVDALQDAEKEFGHWTDEDLHRYKMNHGCNGSKF